jgi:sodium-dependent dicarboxylate transporter 2/3/5
VGLVLGIFAFAAALFWPDLPGLKEQVAQALSVPADHPDVLNVARGAQATLALTLLMVVWWTTEAVPIAITALLPGLMLPCLQVSGIKDGSVFGFTSTAAFSGYANPVIYLFLAGFLLAGGMRKSGLDLRVTLTFLTRKYAARGPATLLLTMMATTAFLSMWISNTATTAMMLPIAVGVLAAFGEQPGTSRFGSAMMLGIAWSASIGGIATVIGSPPNGIVVGILSEQGLADIGFGRWMTFGLPVSISGVLAAWLVLLLIFRPRTGKSNSARAALHRQKQALGAWSRDEIFTVIIVLMVAALWITQPFWKYALPGSVVSRVSGIGVYEIGLACSLLLFVLPVDLKTWRSVLDWGDSKFVDWGTLLLFGGGIALSTAMFRTGLTEWLAGGLINYFGTATPWVSLIVVVLLVDFLTEITSNTAVTAMMAPILISLAPHLNLDPLLLCVVAAMASSLAFMLPVATPPNALVYATGYFRIGQMMRAGFLMNLTGCATLMAVIYLLSGLLFP